MSLIVALSLTVCGAAEAVAIAAIGGQLTITLVLLSLSRDLIFSPYSDAACAAVL